MPGAFDNPYWGGGGFAPVDPLGQSTQGFGGALTSRGNSLIGMGMGLLQPYRPWAGESPWTNALQGWQTGSAADIASARTQQQIRQQALERQDRLAQQTFSRGMEERRLKLAEEQFKRGGETEAERAARLVLPPDATDEQRREFYKTFLLPKTEGDWKIVQSGGLFPRPLMFNPRTREFLEMDGSPLRKEGAPSTTPSPATGGGGTSRPVVPGTTLYWGDETTPTPSQATPTTTLPTTTGGPAATAAGPPSRNEGYLRQFGPDEQTLVRGIAEYEIDPASIPQERRLQVLTAAKNYRPDYNMAEFQKRQAPPSGEVAARVGLGRAFLDQVGDIRSRIEKGEYIGSIGARVQGQLGQGAAGEIRRSIDEGADALIRGLTGAGMSIQEAQNYARRYQFSPIDTQQTALSKLDGLERALRYVATEVGKGRGGDDFLKEYRSKHGTTGETTAGPAAPSGGRTGGTAVPTQNWVRDANGNLVRQ
jgi:hypothetical protein